MLMLLMCSRVACSHGACCVTTLGVRLRHLMSIEDQQLADHISRVKTAELKQTRYARLRQVISTGLLQLRERLAARGSSAVLWPWEHTVNFGKAAAEREDGPRRKLLDAYGDSLRFVNKLYNLKFQRMQRKVPAHMPHYLDKAILNAMQATWPDQWNATSSHRFRSSEDMQYAFSYFYYLIHQPRPFDVDEEFAENVDVDGDGTLNRNEVRVFAVMLYGKTARISDGDVSELEEYLKNCTLVDIQQRVDDGVTVTSHESVLLEDAATAQDEEELHAALADVPITVRSIKACPDVYNKMESLVHAQKRYKHEVVPLNEVEFYMVQDNYTIVKERLDGIRAKMPKFICLNDDIKTPDPDPKLFETLREFFESYYPVPSPFELPPERYHLHLWLDELREQSTASFGFYSLVRSCALLVMGVAVVWYFLRRLVAAALTDSGSKQS